MAELAGIERLVSEVIGRVGGEACLARSEALGTVERMAAWLRLVQEWNAKLDLTAARDVRQLVELFVADATILSARAERDPEATLVDVGTGAGAPGLALALMGTARVTLVEPKAKRVAFLRTVVGTLDADVRIESCRASALADGSFDTATSRATFGPEEWLREGSRLARSAVWVLLAREHPPSLPAWEVTDDVRYVLPFSGHERRAVAYRPIRAGGAAED